MKPILSDRDLDRQALELKVRDLKAKLDRLEEQKKAQHERTYAVEIRYVTPQELADMSSRFQFVPDEMDD